MMAFDGDEDGNTHNQLLPTKKRQYLNTEIEINNNKRTSRDDDEINDEGGGQQMILCGSNDKITMSPLKMSQDSSSFNLHNMVGHTSLDEPLRESNNVQIQ